MSVHLYSSDAEDLECVMHEGSRDYIEKPSMVA